MWCFCFVMTMCMELWPCVCVELNQHQFHFQTIWCGPIIILVINKYNVIITKIIWWCKCMLDLPNVVVDNFLLCTSIKSIFPSLSLGFSDLCSLIFNNLKSWNDYLQYYSLFSSRICGTFMIVLDAVLDQLPTSWIVTSWCINNLYLPNTALALGYKIYLVTIPGWNANPPQVILYPFILTEDTPPPTPRMITVCSVFSYTNRISSLWVWRKFPFHFPACVLVDMLQPGVSQLYTSSETQGLLVGDDAIFSDVNFRPKISYCPD